MDMPSREMKMRNYECSVAISAASKQARGARASSGGTAFGFASKALALGVLTSLCAAFAYADGDNPASDFAVTEEVPGDAKAPVDATGRPVDQSSSNFNKTGRYLPGEEVVTPTGKKVKIWSTEGPVPVSQPPEPWDDRSGWSNFQPNIVIDADRHHDRHDRDGEHDDRGRGDGDRSNDGRDGSDYGDRGHDGRGRGGARHDYRR